VRATGSTGQIQEKYKLSNNNIQELEDVAKNRLSCLRWIMFMTKFCYKDTRFMLY
jgi:Rps23 Pro-64 3,4-dihydroxylase Tpa1-like proline 4-hydroxylase